ncbi:MAG TPA: PspC domain-containing protein [Terriglobia bacterium]|jgi:phage shock protein C
MKRLYRSPTDKRIAGVFGGIGEVYGVDATLLRLAAVFLGLATGLLPLIVTYVVGWIIIPKGPLHPATVPPQQAPA